MPSSSRRVRPLQREVLICDTEKESLCFETGGTAKNVIRPERRKNALGFFVYKENENE